ncbi:MAG: alpha/beta hydrolase fold domain-containing protein [Acidimicrobiales bacterium]
MTAPDSSDDDDLRAILDWLHVNVFDARVPREIQRANLAAALSALEPGEGIARDDVVLGGVPCGRLTPRDVVPGRAIVYAHGGGYCIGSPAMGHALGSALATALRAPWYGVDYRLAPEHPAPAALDDVGAVLAAMGDHEVVVVGDSSGAGALVAAMVRGAPAVRAAALLSPWLDLAAPLDESAPEPLLSVGWLRACASDYAGADLANPQVSPIDAPWASLPPTLLVGGGVDLVAGDARRVAAKGVDNVTVREFAGLGHDFALAAGASAAADQAARLMAEHLGRHAAWLVRA